MKAVLLKQHGDPNVLDVIELPDPRPEMDQVIVDIKAAAMNHLDLWVRRGVPHIPLPIILGSDGAGIISDIGTNVGNHSVGDRVVIQPLTYCGACPACKNGKQNFCSSFGIFGETENGTQCEKMIVDKKYVYPIPEDMDFHIAAGFPLVSETAYMMLVKRAHIVSGEIVFIWGASSGIGHIAIQIAKTFGCKVITTAGTVEKQRFAETLGADLVLNYQHDDIVGKVKEYTDGNGVDVVFEHVGNSTWKTSSRILGKGGRIVTCGATTGAKVDIDLRYLFYRQQSIIGSTMGDVSTFESMLSLVSDAKITPHIDKTFQLENIREAHHYMENGKQIGKIILIP